jgi:hypothetical protein
MNTPTREDELAALHRLVDVLPMSRNLAPPSGLVARIHRLIHVPNDAQQLAYVETKVDFDDARKGHCPKVRVVLFSSTTFGR